MNKENIASLLQETMEVTRYGVSGYKHCFDYNEFKREAMINPFVVSACPYFPSDLILPRFRGMLQEFVDTEHDSIGNNMRFVTSGGFNGSLEEFVSWLLVASGALGAERVAEILLKWINGGSIRYKEKYIISGITISELIDIVEEGVYLRNLPKSEDKAVLKLPHLFKEFHGTMGILGQLVLSVFCEVKPALVHPRNSENKMKMQKESGNTDRFNIDIFCQAASLQKEISVKWHYSWHDLGELQRIVFQLPISTHIPTLRLAEPFTQEDLVRTWEIYLSICNSNKIEGSSLNISIQRWSKSLGNAPFEDKLIDLRIALESLYPEENRISDKLAVRGAWHTAVDFDQRMESYKLLKEFYKLASSVVHGKEKKFDEKNKQIFQDASKICRNGILRKLKQETELDYLKLILGGSENS